MITVLNGVHPKPGRMATGAYTGGTSPIRGDVFGFRGKPLPIINSPTGPLSAFNTGVVRSPGGHPLSNTHNVATLSNVPAAAIAYNGSLEPPMGRSQGFKTGNVMPHEHGRSFGTKVQGVIRRTGGPSKDHSTPFHPKKGHVIVNRPKRPSAIAGERTKAPSFQSHQRMLADPLFRPHDGAARWATVKRGAAK